MTGLRLVWSWCFTLGCFGDYGFLPDKAKLLFESSGFPGRNAISCENVFQEFLSPLFSNFPVHRVKLWGNCQLVVFSENQTCAFNISQGNAGPQSALAVR